MEQWTLLSWKVQKRLDKWVSMRGGWLDIEIVKGVRCRLGELRTIETTGAQTVTKAHWKDGNLTGLAVVE